MRAVMAKLGFRTVNEMVGRSDLLKVDDSLRNPKTANLDLSPLLKPAWQMRPGGEYPSSGKIPIDTDERLSTKCSRDLQSQATRPQALPSSRQQVRRRSRT